MKNVSDQPNTNTIKLVESKQETKQFISLPYSLYKEDKFWVPPLLNEQNKLIDTSKNPFYNEAEIVLFNAFYNEQPAGRIAAIIDHRFNRYHQEKDRKSVV